MLEKIKNLINKKSIIKNREWPCYDKPWLNEFPKIATILDIYFCFRLILGRNPNKEEWSGHSQRKGELLYDIVQTYLQSQEFANRNLLHRNTPSNIKKVKYDDFEIFAANDDIAVGMHVLSGNFELDVTHIFKAILKPNMSVIDIGANIGYYSILSSSLVGDKGFVMAVEPNSENIKFIESSRRLNNFKQLHIIQAAASIHEDIMVLRNEYSNGTCSSLPTNEGELFASEIVGCLRIDKLVENKIDLIKVDVEGGELLAIQGCINIIDKYKPIVVFEFSPNRISDINGNISWEILLKIFFDRKYQLAVIKPEGNLWICHNSSDAYNAFDESGVDHIDLIAFSDKLPDDLIKHNI